MSHRAASIPSNRLEAFSDGVFAIIITIMVLGIHTPAGHHFSDLTQLRPVFLSYLMSFVYVIIYWNNHHYLLKTLERPSGLTMWANSNLLFWLSLVPLSTNWVGTSVGAKAPAAVYGFTLLMPAISYTLLQIAIIGTHGEDSTLKRALGSDVKGKISLVCYIAGIGISFLTPIISYALYAAVAIMWVIPDRRIIGELDEDHH